jgi:hypothetical protein
MNFYKIYLVRYLPTINATKALSRKKKKIFQKNLPRSILFSNKKSAGNIFPQLVIVKKI